MTVVFSTGSLAELVVAKLLLEAEGIPYVVQGEGVQNLFGFGTIFGYNPITGPVELRVADEDADLAREAVAEIHTGGE